MTQINFIDECISKLRKIKETEIYSNEQILKFNEIQNILKISRDILIVQPALLHLASPLAICGDLHGNYFDLLRIFEKCGDPSITNYLFLGDYIDRGKFSINTITLLLLYKIKYPQNFFLLRGNHETRSINKQYGFYDECKKNYNSKIWYLFNDVFDFLPISALIENRIFCIHGGISPKLKNLNQLSSIQRPIQDPNSGFVCDLLWSDPSTSCNFYASSNRGNGVFFGQRSVQNFLDKYELDLLVRSHQFAFNGYLFPFYPNQSIVTIFSSSNYCGKYKNCGAVMTVNENLVCKFIVFEPIEENKC